MNLGNYLLQLNDASICVCVCVCVCSDGHVYAAVETHV